MPLAFLITFPVLEPPFVVNEELESPAAVG